MITDSTHFVRYRLKDTHFKEHYITFHSRAPKSAVVAQEHPVIQHLAETDAEAASNVERLIQELLTHEKSFFAWLGSDGIHMEQFMKDPISALKQAIPDLPDSFFDDLNSLPKIIQK